MITFNCDYDGTPKTVHESVYARTKRHFCSRKCYTLYRELILPTEEQNAFQGGVTPEESRRRWREKNRKVIAARNAARKQREIDAPGHHTAKEWREYRKTLPQVCVEEDETCRGALTKDHEIPLIAGGSNDLSNLQLLCSSHNSRKKHHIRVTFEERKA